MESAPWTVIAAIAVAVVLLGILARFFFRLLKHLLFALIIGVIAAFIWVQMQPSAPVNPSIGKRAYSSVNGEFVGTVVASGEDPKLGAVWIIQQPGGYKVKYPKSFLQLRDQ
ncbi:MAG: hypothetical protein KIT57_00945 [Blastocatellales bacterium]|nr:hypothetical protein [Blastocatellales bacterium]